VEGTVISQLKIFFDVQGLWTSSVLPWLWLLYGWVLWASMAANTHVLYLVSIGMQAIAGLEGMVVIDVVEGTALSSLPYMATLLKQRPSSFDSQEAAVHWARRSGETTVKPYWLMCFDNACLSLHSLCVCKVLYASWCIIHLCLLPKICLAHRLIQQIWHANLLGESH